MKIVMLGHTGVGKTTYMASLYDSMQQRVEGFHLKTAKSQDDSHLLDLAKMIRYGNYPPLTAHRDEYDFNLQYQGKDVIHFFWADYRGGALTEKSQSSEQANLLIQDLKQADGIMMFCDCDAIVRGNIRAIQLGRMTNFINRAFQDVEHPIALSIILTKVDLVVRFEEELLSPFKNLIDVINASEWVLGAFIPIYCGIQSANVPMPLLFTLHKAVELQVTAVKNSAKEHSNKALMWREQSKGFSGFMRWVEDKWNGNLTDNQMAELSDKRSVEKYQQFEAIRKPAEALVKYVEKLPLISKDKTTKRYIEELSVIKLGIGLSQSLSNSLYKIHSDPFDAFS